MKTSNELSEIAAALVEAQSEIQGVSKDGAGNRGKKYMTLDAILSEVKPVLYLHDLTLIQSVTGSELGGIGVTTRVLHKSGQWIEDTSMFPLDDSGNKSDVQGAGSSITYQRRYAVAAFFGIVADEDNDGRRPEVRRNTATAGNHTIVNNPPAPIEKLVMVDTKSAMFKRFQASGQAKWGDEWDEKRAAAIEYVTDGRTRSSTQATTEEIAEALTLLERNKAQ